MQMNLNNKEEGLSAFGKVATSIPAPNLFLLPLLGAQ